MAEPMDNERRARFLANIHTEAFRIQRIVDRMLELAALENREGKGAQAVMEMGAG